jgi:hypothetical protein
VAAAGELLLIGSGVMRFSCARLTRELRCAGVARERSTVKYFAHPVLLSQFD